MQLILLLYLLWLAGVISWSGIPSMHPSVTMYVNIAMHSRSMDMQSVGGGGGGASLSLAEKEPYRVEP